MKKQNWIDLIFRLSESRFIISLFLLSFIVRIILAKSHIQYPNVPTDLMIYLEGGKVLLSGKPIYTTPLTGYASIGSIWHYGPLFPTIIAGWISLFGEGFGLLKMPFVIFSSLYVIPLFYLIKKFSDYKSAKYFTIVFMFSWLPMLSGGIITENNTYFMFFVLTAFSFLLYKRYKFSAVSIAIACGFKVIPFVFLPVIAYYIYQTSGIKQAIKYFSIFTIIFLIMLFPFYLNSGGAVIRAFTGVNYIGFHPVPTPIQYCPLNAMRIGCGIFLNIIHYLLTSTMIPYDQNSIKASVICPINVFFERIGTPFFILGLILAFCYMFKFRMKDKNLELIRNSFVFVLLLLFFGSALTSFYFLWFFPFFLSILSFKEREKFKEIVLKKGEIAGIVLVFIGALIYGTVFRWRSDIPEYQRLLLWMPPFLIGVGTFFMFLRSRFKIIWSLITFTSVMENEIKGNLLLTFRPILTKFIPDVPIGPFETCISYGTFYGLYFSIAFMYTIAMVILFRRVHISLKEDES